MNHSKVQVTFDVTGWSATAVQQLLETGDRLAAGIAPAITPAVAPATSHTGPTSWTPALVEELLERVTALGGIGQARSIRFALGNGGTVDRSTALQVSGKSHLRAFTVKIQNAVAGMQEDGILDSAIEPESVFVPYYPPGVNQAESFSLAPEVMAAFAADAA